MRNNDIYILILGSGRFKDSRIEHVCNSWLRSYSNYFISCDAPLRGDVHHIVATKHNDSHSCPPKIFKGLEYITSAPNNCSWLFIGDDDTFVNSINLNSFVAQLNPAEKKMYGKDMTGNYPYKTGQIKYLSGGGGTLLPMCVAQEIIKKIKSEKWMEWLCRPRQIPAKHEGDYPTAAGADTKLGWVAGQLGIEQVSYPHLFYPESYKKYKHEPTNILQCITYHRQYGEAQKQLNDIVFKDVKANTLSLTPPTPKPAPTTQSEVVVRNVQTTSYYIDTELLLLRKKIERLEKQVYLLSNDC
jgi:hypothetical protein